jgi:hypothetical protein
MMASAAGTNIAAPNPCAGDYQRQLRPREPASQRGSREQGQPCHEHPPPAEEVGEPARQEQEATEEEHVGRNHPLKIARSKPEVPPYRGQGYDHRVDVEHINELRNAQQDQRPPPPARARPLLLPGARTPTGTFHGSSVYRYTLTIK